MARPTKNNTLPINQIPIRKTYPSTGKVRLITMFDNNMRLPIIASGAFLIGDTMWFLIFGKL